MGGRGKRWPERAGAWLGAGVVVVGLTASPGAGAAESPSAWGLLPELKTPELAGDARSAPAAPAPEPDYWLGGRRSLGLGLDLSRIQPNIGSKVVSAPTVPQGAVAARLIDPELHFDAVSFDLKVRWPAAAGLGSSSLRPHVSFGPALFVARPGDLTALGLPGARREYRFTQSGPSRLLPIGERGALGRDADTSDLLYGISVRF